MSVKIKVSYTEEKEADIIMGLLSPIKHNFKVKKSDNTAPYKHLYFTSRNAEKGCDLRG